MLARLTGRGAPPAAPRAASPAAPPAPLAPVWSKCNRDVSSYTADDFLNLIRCEYEILPIGGDGNCQFRSVAVHAYGDSIAHAYDERAMALLMDLRTKSCQRSEEILVDMRRNVENEVVEHAIMNAFNIPEAQIPHWKETCGTDGNWGNDLTLRAMTDILGVTIVCTHDGATHGCHIYTPTRAGVVPDKAWFVDLIGNHYEAWIPAPTLRVRIFIVSRDGGTTLADSTVQVTRAWSKAEFVAHAAAVLNVRDPSMLAFQKPHLEETAPTTSLRYMNFHDGIRIAFTLKTEEQRAQDAMRALAMQGKNDDAQIASDAMLALSLQET